MCTMYALLILFITMLMFCIYVYIFYLFCNRFMIVYIFHVYSAFPDIKGKEPNTVYSYNPCYNFTDGGCDNVAVSV